MGARKTLAADHPGTFIVEELEARNWQQIDLAYILGISAQQLNPLLTGKAGITPDMAAALGDAFGMPAEFFANLQKLYDLHKVKLRTVPALQTPRVSAFHAAAMTKRA